LTEEEPYDRRGTPTSAKRRQQTVKHELLWPLTTSEESDHWVEKSGKLEYVYVDHHFSRTTFD